MAKFIGAFFATFHYKNTKNFTWVDRDFCSLLSGLLRSPTCLFHLSNRFQNRIAASGINSLPYHRLITIKHVLLFSSGFFSFFNVCDMLIAEVVEATKRAHGISKQVFHFNGWESKLTFRRSRNWPKPSINCEVREETGRNEKCTHNFNRKTERKGAY